MKTTKTTSSKTTEANVPTFDSHREKAPLGEIRRDRQPSEKFPKGRIVLGIPTTTGNNQRGYMTVAEALEQKAALVSTDPAHEAYGFRVTTEPVTLNVGDLFQVVGKMCEQQIVDLSKDYPDTKEEPITALPQSGSITNWYEEKPTIKAHLKIGDLVRINDRLYKIGQNGNDWIKLEKQPGQVKAKRVVVTVTLDQDDDGIREWHISRPGYPGNGSDTYGHRDGPPHSDMAKDLGAQLVKLLGAR